jgi:MFS family permease
MSPPASREESKAGATPLLRSMTILRSFALHDMKIVAVGTILGGICAAVVTTYWGTATTSAKLLGKLGKPQSTTSWKWIIVCAIVGAILAFCVSRVLKKRRSVGTPRQPLPPRHTPRSAGPVSAEEIEEAIKRMESARRDMFGIAGDVGILGIGAAGGGIAAVAVAAFFGATSIWGVTRAGKWMGLSVHGGTPWIWIIGCAVVGAALAFSVSRLIRSGAQAAERRKRNIDELKRDVEKRRKEAEKSTVDKDKFGKLVESLTMLLSNGKITPEESDGLIEGIKSGGMSYEFAFSFIEELLRE